jgi:uncharacterized protein
MKYFFALIASFCFAITAFADEPTKESVEKLLAATKMETMVTTIQHQMESSMSMALEQSLKGETLSAEAKQHAEAFRQKIVAAMTEELSWEKVKGLYIQIYSDNFTQEEIDALNDFYDSQTGKMYVAKMPVVMQKSMAIMQQKMGPMREKIQAAMKEMRQEIEDMKKKKTDKPS